jgi:hypothetical protein
MGEPDPKYSRHAYQLAARLFEAFMVESLKNRPLQTALEKGDGFKGDNLLANVARAALGASSAFCKAAEEAEGISPPWTDDD